MKLDFKLIYIFIVGKQAYINLKQLHLRSISKPKDKYRIEGILQWKSRGFEQLKTLYTAYKRGL